VIGGADAMASPPIVPQRLAIVLPTSGAFDSRTFRIATTCVRRGHQVTVLARAEAGLPTHERHPAGYRIVRVPVDPVDALPLSGVWRRLRARRRRDSRRLGAAVMPGATVEPQPQPEWQVRGVRRTVGSAARAAWRLAAIALTVRAQAAAVSVADEGADLYHAMAYMGIPVALATASRHDDARRGRPPVVYDARDIYLEARNLARLPRAGRWVVARLERRWAHRSARVTTVNQAYAEVMRDRLGVQLPLVVMNCSLPYRRPEPPPRHLCDRLGLSPDRRIVLYHGGLFPERGIEQLIAAWPAVPDAELVLMGYGVLEAQLPARITASPAADRIHVLPAVPPEELHDWIASADVAAMPIQPTTLNHRLTTPNKLFEAMAAGVPVVASDLPGMASIVTETACGVLCDPTDPAAIAAAIRSILDLPAEDRAAIGQRGARAVAATYNWDSQAEILLAEYTRLTGQAW
jgi:glycosyltransferase involved in cell wall biosynthesis